MSLRTAMVSNVYFIESDQEIIAHLASFDWDFAPGNVRIRSGDDMVPLRQVGSGNHEGHPVVTLHPLGTWSDAVASLRTMQAREDQRMTIER